MSLYGTIIPNKQIFWDIKILNTNTQTSNSIQQNPFFEAKRSSAIQEILRFLWNPMVHSHIHEHMTPVPVLSHLNSVNAPPSHFLKIHFNIILPYMPGRYKWPLSIRSPHQNPLGITPVHHTCHMPRPAHY